MYDKITYVDFNEVKHFLQYWADWRALPKEYECENIMEEMISGVIVPRYHSQLCGASSMWDIFNALFESYIVKKSVVGNPLKSWFSKL